MLHPVGGGETNLYFSLHVYLDFCPQSPTHTTDPRVGKGRLLLAPVENTLNTKVVLTQGPLTVMVHKV